MAKDVLKVKVAAIQAAPVLPMNKQATTEKACRLIEEAGSQGARLVAFPEGFIPMFPNWAVDMARPNEWADNLAELILHSVEVPSEETRAIGEAARKAGAVVVMGLNERRKDYPGMLYNSLVFFGPDGKVLGRHRKFTPSHRERVFHGRGDGSDLNCVFDTEVGKVGGLICYEHLQPLFKYALIAQGEQIHCACWPGSWPHYPPPGRSNKEIVQIASRAYAIEGSCFVVAASTYIPEEAAEVANLGNAHWGFPGGSAVIDPNGEYLAGPVYGKETILYADVDLYQGLRRKCYIDVCGRDARWDVIRLDVNTKAYTPWDRGPAKEGEAGQGAEVVRGLTAKVEELEERLAQLSREHVAGNLE